MKEIKPLSLAELKALRQPVRNVNISYREKLTPMEKIALWITVNIGSMGFFFIILGFNAGWMLWNVFAPAELIFDTAWEFLVLLFINNILQILFMPLIMVGQNLQGRHSEARAEADFEVNVKAEREIENILLHLEQQNKLILQILRQVEREEKVEVGMSMEAE
jgi:uncharacterized membrane protein